jgi:hypothetical protein
LEVKPESIGRITIDIDIQFAVGLTAIQDNLYGATIGFDVDTQPKWCDFGGRSGGKNYSLIIDDDDFFDATLFVQTHLQSIAEGMQVFDTITN